ncbi:MAG: ThiF family adenylyltransferase [Flavobacteriales bacterium]
MDLLNYSRIESAFEISKIKQQHIIVVGSGGSYSYIKALARCGIGKLTVLDFDTVDSSNIVRQGYDISDIGKYKVDALGERIAEINPSTEFQGITKNFLDMSDSELDVIFEQADLFLFLTDDFKAQSFGNILSLKYLKPTLWAGWYALSRTSEIFYQIPEYTKTCFRCCMSQRYLMQNSIVEEAKIQPTSDANTIFHSQLLDSQLGLLTLAILMRSHPVLNSNSSDENLLESESFFASLFDENKKAFNYFHHKAHPKGGNHLFDKAYGHLEGKANLFMSHWQQVEPELKPEYDYDCPDCKGKLNELVERRKS